MTEFGGGEGVFRGMASGAAVGDDKRLGSAGVQFYGVFHDGMSHSMKFFPQTVCLGCTGEIVYEKEVSE